MDILKRQFEEYFRLPVENVEPLQGELGGSGRRIIRLRSGGRSAVGILYGVHEENRAFLEFSRHFRRHGLPVPKIYAEDLGQGAYLEEDLGDITLLIFFHKAALGRASRPMWSQPIAKPPLRYPVFRLKPGAI